MKSVDLADVPVEATATRWNAGAPTKRLESRYYTGGGNPNWSYVIVVLHFDEELKRLAATK